MSRHHPLRVLLLTRFYPPAPEVGGLRPAKLVRALRAAGHEVTVVTAVPPASAPGRGSSEEAAPDGVRIVRVAPHLGPREWLVKVKRHLRGEGATGASEGRSPEPTPPETADAANSSLATKIREWVLSYVWVPDDHQGFIIPAVRAALDEAERAPYDVIVATAPPFSTHIAGVVASKLTGIPLTIEFRDPWNYGDDPLPHLHGSADRLNRWLEHSCLRHAAAVVAVTEQTGALLARRCGALGKPAPLVIRNGIDAVSEAPTGSRGPRPVRVAYVGELYDGRDPRPFLHSLARLRDAGALPPEGIRVDFVGECEVYAGTSVRGLLKALALETMVQLRGRIPHRESLALQRDADVLLLLAQRQPMQVPNKLYEYLGVGRPILAYVDADGESAEMLRRVGGHFLITPPGNAASDAIVRDALRAPLSAWAPLDLSLLHEWSSDVQFARYVAALSERFASNRQLGRGERRSAVALADPDGRQTDQQKPRMTPDSDRPGSSGFELAGRVRAGGHTLGLGAPQPEPAPAWVCVLPPAAEQAVLDVGAEYAGDPKLAALWQALGADVRYVPSGAAGASGLADGELPLAAASVDLVHLAPDATDPSAWRPWLISEAARVLKPSGLVVAHVRGPGWRLGRAAPWTRSSSRVKVVRALRAAGFTGFDVYWCYPDAHQPFAVVDMHRSAMLGHLDWLGAEAWSSPPSMLRLTLKRALAWTGALRWFVSDTVVVAGRGSRRPSAVIWDAWRRLFPSLPALPKVLLTGLTSGTSGKVVVAVREGDRRPARFYLRCDSGISAVGRDLRREQAIVAHVSQLVSSERIHLPEPIGLQTVANMTYAVEAGVPGVSLARLLMSAGENRRLALARTHLVEAVRFAAGLARQMRNDDRLRVLSANGSEYSQKVGQSSGVVMWMQHGDFTIENVFVCPDGRHGVIDWEHLTTSVNPLYDAVSLLLSAVPVLRPNRRDRWTSEDGFQTAFLIDGPWSSLFWSALNLAADDIGIARGGVPAALLAALAQRVTFHRMRGSSLADVHQRFVEMSRGRLRNLA